MVWGVGSGGVSAVSVDLDKLQSSIHRKFGVASLRNYHGWRLMMDNVKDLSADQKIKRVNEFFNRRIQAGIDQEIWGELDYWATPGDTLGKGMGDCEDFAIAKYYSLLNLRIPSSSLRLVYVKASGVYGGADVEPQAHMVLAYYVSPETEPLILDNLITDIRPASRRPDLSPIFSFNSEGIYVGPATQGVVKPGGLRLSRWQDLMRRAYAEGFHD